MGKWSRYFFCAKTKEWREIWHFLAVTDSLRKKVFYTKPKAFIDLVFFLVLLHMCVPIWLTLTFSHTQKRNGSFFKYLWTATAPRLQENKSFCFFSFLSFLLAPELDFVLCVCINSFFCEIGLPSLPLIPLFSFFFRNCKLPPTPILHHRPISPLF